MTNTQERAELIAYIQKTTDELLEPLEAITKSFPDVAVALRGFPDRRGLFSSVLMAILAHFYQVDRNLSKEEIMLAIELLNLAGFKIDYPSQGVPFSLLESHFRTRLAAYSTNAPKTWTGIPSLISIFQLVDNLKGSSYAEELRTMFFRVANAVAKADGKLSEKGKEELEKFKEVLWNPAPLGVLGESIGDKVLVGKSEPAKPATPQELGGVLSELESLIGLDCVKKDIYALVNFLKVQQLRTEKGLPQVPISLHMVFYGNPGTGKTTVARLLAQIYKSLNILSKGHFIETERSGLVAGYLGQTALKVNKVVSDALGGILFIDEAYSLARTDGRDEFGQEAIETLLKAMEDHRDDLVIIVAGYTDKMEQFLTSNPGLRSRFNKYLNFQDYTPSELIAIFESFGKKAKYQLSPEAKNKLESIFTTAYNNRDATFGNARFARNVFEKAINNQASRIVSLANINMQVLSTVEASDIPVDDTNSL